MARLMDVADAAAAEMRERWFGREVKEIAVHSGSYTERELKRLSTETPAIHLALVRTYANENAGAVDASEEAADPVLGAAQRRVEALFVASVLARSEGRGRTSERVAEAIATELLRRIPEQRWGMTFVGPAEQVTLENSEMLAERNMALWLVGWRQTVRLGASAPAGEPPGTLCVFIAGEAPVVLHEAVSQ